MARYVPPALSLRDSGPATFTPEEIYRGTTSVFGQGLRSGVSGIGANLNQIAGLGGEALGADEFATNRYAEADRLRAQAQAEAPLMNEFGKAKSLRDYGDYAAGMAGQLTPMLGGALAAGAVMGPIAGGLATMAPIEAGDIAYRQKMDPETAQMDPVDRLGRAALGGLASGAAQTVLPAGLAAKMGAKAMGGAMALQGEKSFGKAMVGNIAEGAATNYAASGVGELTKQQAANGNKDWDMGAAHEAGVGGAVVGGIAHVPVGLAAYAKGKGEAVGDAASGVKAWGSKKLAAAADTASKVADDVAASEPAKKFNSLFDDASDMLVRGKEALADVGGKIVRGEPIVDDLTSFAKATGDRAKEMLDLSDNKGAQWVKEKGDQLLNKIGLDDPKRQEIMDAMANGADRAGQLTMHGLVTAFEKGEKVGKNLKNLAKSLGTGVTESDATSKFGDLSGMLSDAVKRHLPGGKKAEAATTKEPKLAATPEARDAFIAEQMAQGKTKREAMQAFTEATKESRDYSGAEQMVLGVLKEVGLHQKQPDLFSPKNIKTTGSTLRMMLDKMANGIMNKEQSEAAYRVFGEDTGSIVSALRKTLGDSITPEQNERFFQNLNEIETAKQRTEDVHNQLRMMMPPETQQLLGGVDDLAELVDLGVAHAQGTLLSNSGRNNRTAAEISAAETAVNRRVREVFAQRFGDRTDAALDLIGKYARMESEGDVVGTGRHLDENGNVIDSAADAMEATNGSPIPAEMEVMRFGLTKPDARGNSKSEMDGRPMTKDNKYVKQHILDIKAKYPDYDVKWQRAEGKDGEAGLGHIVAEKFADPESITPAEVESMRLDTTNRSRSTDRIEFKKDGGEPLIVDSWKVAHIMHNRLERGALDNLSTEQRMARMFVEGIARLTEKYGAPVGLKDDVRVARINGKDLTWGMVKKIDARTVKDKAYDRDTERLYAAKNELASIGPNDTARVGELERVISQIEEDRAHNLIREQAFNDDIVGSNPMRKGELPPVPDAQGRPVSPMRSRMDDSVGAAKRNNINGIEQLTGETMKPDKAGNIHVLSQRVAGEDEPSLYASGDHDGERLTGRELMKDGRDTTAVEGMINKTNMAGEPHFVSDRTDFSTSMKAAARDLERDAPNVIQKKAAKVLTNLMRSDINLSKYHRDQLGAVLLPDVRPSDKVRIINEVAANYKEVLRKRGPQKPGKVIEGKEVDGPPEYYGDDLPPDYDFDSLPKVESPKTEAPKVEEPLKTEAPKPYVRTDAKPTMLENAVNQRIKALTPQSAAAHESWAQKELTGPRAKNGNDVAALHTLIEKAQELQGKSGSAPSPKALPPEQGGVSGSAPGVKLTGGAYVGKDNVKSLQATKFIGRGSEASSTASYAKQWGDRANTGNYTAQDRVFVSAEGARTGRVDPDVVEISKATKAGATILTDSMTTGRERPYNVGERQIAQILTEQKYVETSPGVWKPSPEVTAKKAAFLDRVASGDKALTEEISTSRDVKGLQRAVDTLIQEYAPMIVPEKYRVRAREYIERVLGEDIVALVFDSKKLEEMMAGASHGLHMRDPNAKFDVSKSQETIHVGDVTYGGLKVERTYLYHESAHALFSRLLAHKKFANSAEVLIKVATSDAIQQQLAKLHEADPRRLSYIRNNPEEAVAYMYQHWANGELKITDKPTLTLFEHIKKFLQAFLRTLSDEQHADALFRFFHEGNLKGEFTKQSSTDIYNAKLLSREKGYIRYTDMIDNINDRIAEIMAEDKEAGYALQTYAYNSHGATSTGKRVQQPVRDEVGAHIEKVLAKSVKLAWTSILAAGSYTHALGKGLIQLSVHALDPMGTAYHESLHAFFGQLRDAGAHDITNVLKKAANSEHVIEQLNEIYKGNADVLKQLTDPEERAAYMYQHWALDPKGFKVSIAARGVFQKITALIHKVMGTWTNDERAVHIMEYFHSGEYAKDMNAPNIVREKLMEAHRSKILDTAKSFTEPLGRLADAMVGTGSERLRDMDIPAITELADAIKRPSTKEGGDQGFIQAARVQTTKHIKALGDALGTTDQAVLSQVLEAMQRGEPGTTPQVQTIVKNLKGLLQGTREYMTMAGVKMGDLGPNYFPRVWDTHYISQNQKAFRAMLEPYVRSGKMEGSADQFVRNLISRDGNEFGIETREPGMQFTKRRDLDFFDPKDIAPFLNKDLLGTMTSYLSQAARKAEWTRRLGEGRLEKLLKQAEKEGATPDQLNTVETYLKGVDGTLGDSLNPHARRIMGNMIVYQNVRLLPLAAFSMLIDPNGIMVRGGTVSEAWNTLKRGIKEIKGNLSKEGAAPDEAARIAELVGVVDSAMMSSVMGDLYTQGMVGGGAKKINDAFFKYNMVEGLNRSFRIGATEAAINFLARHADLKHSPHSKRWMAELGIQVGDIKNTAKSGGRIALTVQEGLTPAQVSRVHAAINQWVDGAILRPDAADKPIWMNDPRFALVAHLKQFVFAFQETILKRTMHEMRNGNYTPMMALASYLPVMIAADMAKGALVSGGGQPDWQEGWTAADYVGYGVQRAGFLGVGQFGLDMVKDFQRGGTGIGALSGPTLEQFGGVLNVLGGRKQFGNVAVHSLPANALYMNVVGHTSPEPVHAE